MVKFRTTAEDVPKFVTDAWLPAGPVVTVPIAMVEAAPEGPEGPMLPACESMAQTPGLSAGSCELLALRAM
jgi:hypothetical protein